MTFMTGEMVDVGLCPACKEHCEICDEYEECEEYDMQPIVDLMDLTINCLRSDNTIYLGKQGRGVV